MSSAPAAPKPGIRFVIRLEREDVAHRGLDLESRALLREAEDEPRMAEISPDEQTTATLVQDRGFSCEWWPPD